MFKKFILLSFLIIALAFLNSCSFGNDDGNIFSDVVSNPNTANGKTDKSQLPVIEFEEQVHDFGKIIEGETVSFSFKFKNTGKTDLIVADVSTSCGCTVPSYPKTPIRPGEENTIKVAFNSAGRRGYQSKDIVVVSNTQPNTTLIRIKATVVSPGSER